MDKTDETYPGGIASLTAQWERRRVKLNYGDDAALPLLDVDFAPLKSRMIPSDVPDLPEDASRGARKRQAQMAEMTGLSELALLNAQLIANLRKRRFPEHAPALFRRLWAEEGPFLIQELDNRWLISSVITFADHGETEADRRIGQSLNVLFSLTKLYEFERQFSGLDAGQPFPLGKRKRQKLPMAMPPFALMRGDLEANFLAPLWRDATLAPDAGLLAEHLLKQLNREPRSLFRRFKQLRDIKRARQARRNS